MLLISYSLIFFQCERCDRSFVTRSQLKFHISCDHEGVKKHICETCGKAFEKPSSLKMHVATVHEGIKNFKCTHCGKAFGKKSTLNRHINKTRCKGLQTVGNILL